PHEDLGPRTPPAAGADAGELRPPHRQQHLNVVVMKLAATSESWLGRISAKMMRLAPSPLARAAVTNSRLRIESVCARSTRAPQGQLVSATTSAMVSVVRLKSSTASSASGKPGITRKTLVSSESASSAKPPK